MSLLDVIKEKDKEKKECCHKCDTQVHGTLIEDMKGNVIGPFCLACTQLVLDER